jgi:hypothetical protein
MPYTVTGSLGGTENNTYIDILVSDPTETWTELLSIRSLEDYSYAILLSDYANDCEHQQNKTTYLWPFVSAT